MGSAGVGRALVTTALIGLVAGLPGRASAQEAGAEARSGRASSSTDEVCFGSLGIAGFRDGRVSVTRRDDGRFRFRFYSEPVITGVVGAAKGELKAGDVLVALDGHLITTEAGNRRYNHLESGEEVEVRVRRDGRERTVTVPATRRCVPAPAGSEELAEEAPGTVPPDRLEGEMLAPPRPGDPPRVHLGLTLHCEICGVRPAGDGGREWFFRGPVRVVEIVEGGPADRANIPEGWELHAIDGKELDTEAGARAFQEMKPGESYMVMSRKPGTRTLNLGTLVPERPREGEDGGEAGGLESADAAPAETEPVRFSDTLAGVSVEVRGDPITVRREEGRLLLRIGGTTVTLRESSAKDGGR